MVHIMLLITGLIYNPFRRQMNSLFLEQFFKAKLHSQSSIVTVAKIQSNDSVLSGCKKVRWKEEKKKVGFSSSRYQSMYATFLEPIILDFNLAVELSHLEILKGILLFTITFGDKWAEWYPTCKNQLLCRRVIFRLLVLFFPKCRMVFLWLPSFLGSIFPMGPSPLALRAVFS